MKLMPFVVSLILLSMSSFADIQSSSHLKKSGRKLDLGFSKKTAPANDEHQARGDRRSDGYQKDGYQKIDMSQFKEFEMPKAKTSAKLNCKGKSGTVYGHKDAGFDSCLRQAEAEKASSQHRPSDPNGTSVGVEFGDIE